MSEAKLQPSSKSTLPFVAIEGPARAGRRPAAQASELWEKYAKAEDAIVGRE